MIRLGIAFPLNLIPLYRSVLIFFILVSGAALNGIAGVTFTHIMMDVAAALVVILILARYTARMREYVSP